MTKHTSIPWRFNTIPLWQKQVEAQKKHLKALREQAYSLADPYIVINPWHNAPLTALLAFDTKIPTRFLVEIVGKEPETTLRYLSKYTTKHQIEILWLCPNDKNTIRLIDDDGHIFTYTIQTPAIDTVPDHLDLDGLIEPGNILMVLPASAPHFPLGYDCKGRLRWMLTTPLFHQVRRKSDGNLLCGGSEAITPPFGAAGLWTVTLDGRILERCHFSGYLCGEACEVANGNIAAISQSPHIGTCLDNIVLLDQKNKNEVKRAVLQDWLPITTKGTVDKTGTDWVHLQGLYYDETDHSLRAYASHLKKVCTFSADLENLTLTDAPSFEDPSGLSISSQPKGASLSTHLERMLWQNDGSLMHLIGVEEGLSHLCQRKASSCTSRLTRYHLPSRPSVSASLPFALIDATIYTTSSFRSYNINTPLNTLYSNDEATPPLDVSIPIQQSLPLDTEEIPFTLTTDGEALYVEGDVFQGEMVILELEQKDKSALRFYMPTSLKPYGATWLHSYHKGPERTLRYRLSYKSLKAGPYAIALIIDDTRYTTDYRLDIEKG